MTLCLECDRWYAGSYWAHIYFAHKEAMRGHRYRQGSNQRRGRGPDYCYHATQGGRVWH